MNNFLEISASHDSSDSSLELTVRFNVEDFSGSGSAYFDVDTLSRNVESLDAFPLPSDEDMGIKGGYWENGRLKETHASITFSAGERGLIRVTVEVARPCDVEPDRGPAAYAKATCLIDYETLARLRRGVAALIASEKSTFRLPIPDGI